MLDKYKDVLSVNEVAEILGIGKGLAYKLIHEGKIKCVKAGSRILVPKYYLKVYLKASSSPHV